MPAAPAECRPPSVDRSNYHYQYYNRFFSVCQDFLHILRVKTLLQTDRSITFIVYAARFKVVIEDFISSTSRFHPLSNLPGYIFSVQLQQIALSEGSLDDDFRFAGNILLRCRYGSFVFIFLHNQNLFQNITAFQKHIKKLTAVCGAYPMPDELSAFDIRS